MISNASVNVGLMSIIIVLLQNNVGMCICVRVCARVCVCVSA